MTPYFVAENGRLQTSQVGTAASAYLSRQYNYFNNGNIQSITDLLDGDKTQSFGYDELDRLKTANSVIYGALTYNYDQLGNLTHKEGIDFFTDTTNKPHQLVSSSNGRYYDYDANGNMLSDGVRSFTYDTENRPVLISFNGAVSEFVYNGTGNRVKKSGPHGETTYIAKLYEVNGTSTAKYIFAGQKRIAMVNQLDTYYYHQDHLGGTSVVTDGNGNKVEQLFYKPFGETIEDSGTVSLNHKYTGQELDAETDLYFYNARYYNPAIGRFTSADTIVPHFNNPQSYNRYSYVLNNPLKYNDPTGHIAVSVSMTSMGVQINVEVYNSDEVDMTPTFCSDTSVVGFSVAVTDETTTGKALAKAGIAETFSVVKDLNTDKVVGLEVGVGIGSPLGRTDPLDETVKDLAGPLSKATKVVSKLLEKQTKKVASFIDSVIGKNEAQVNASDINNTNSDSQNIDASGISGQSADDGPSHAGSGPSGTGGGFENHESLGL